MEPATQESESKRGTIIIFLIHCVHFILFQIESAQEYIYNQMF